MLVCERLHNADPGKSFIHHCHTVLNRALGHVHFAAELYQLDPFLLKEHEIRTLDEDYWIPVFKDHMQEHPFAAKMIAISDYEIGATHREASLMEFRQTVLFNEFYDQVEAQNQIWIGIRQGNDLLNCVYSREREYSEAELSLLHIIQPHLELAWKNWRRTRALKQELDLLKGAIFKSETEQAAAAQLRKSIESLTSRQRDVVEQVAQGRDNQEISEELGISPMTVKKHLQLVFQALKIRHRTELAAQWHQAHSIMIH